MGEGRGGMSPSAAAQAFCSGMRPSGRRHVLQSMQACRAMQQAAVETAGIRMAGMSGGAARRTGHRCAV
jgi:hypothetical protein